MRHRIKGRKLKRTASHRAALMNALATSLLKHKRIRTTEAKAKEARKHIEAIITKARKNDLNSMRQVMTHIKDKKVVKELFTEIVPKIGDRPGGYTRVIKLGNRIGDAAGMAVIELVDYNDVINAKAQEQKEKREARREQKKAEKKKEVPEVPVTEEILAEKNK